jgi:hypothetical protein
VGTRREAAAGSRHHEHSHAVVAVQLGEHGEQRVAKLAVERVQLVWAVQGEQRDVAIALEQNRLGSHGRLPVDGPWPAY